jgi:hypothetical protein
MATILSLSPVEINTGFIHPRLYQCHPFVHDWNDGSTIGHNVIGGWTRHFFGSVEILDNMIPGSL